MKLGTGIDFSDVFASGIGLVLRQIVLFTLAGWLGCSLAAFSFLAADIARAFEHFDPGDLMILLYSPSLLLNLWLPLNMLFLPILLWRVISCADSIGYRTWCLLIGGEALFAMAGVHLRGWPRTLAWVCCLFLIATVWAGIWYLYQWRLKRWAGELMALEIENAERRRELKEEFGTESAGFKETGAPEVAQL